MALKLTCPSCGQKIPITEPLPLAGDQVMCGCGNALLVTWPPDVLQKLNARGMRFRAAAQKTAPVLFDDSEAPAPERQESSVSTLNAQEKRAPKAPPPPPHPSATPAPVPLVPMSAAPGPAPFDRPSSVGTQIETTQKLDQDPNSVFGFGDRTVPSQRTPYGALPGNLPEADAQGPMPRVPGPDGDVGEPVTRPDLKTEEFEPKWSPPPKKSTTPQPAAKAATDRQTPAPAKAATPARRRSAAGCVARLGALGMPLAAAVLCSGLAGAGGGYWYFSQDLPSVEALQGYEPPTSTIIYDRNGEIMGEIYEERRYVTPLEKFPAQVQNAFISAEDANFRTHDGVDYMGIVRAVLRNAAAGKKAQGASTITQQVTRNFLLTREKSIVRKIKEVILAWRIEDVYDKDHILWLYLNEIYLGSGAYGVEAAARVYFDKHADELTLSEAAMLAGLPPAPSQYSPHKNFDLAKERQAYVLEQMVKNGYITQTEADAAYAEKLQIVERSSDFLQKAPHFTEHVRRYLVDKYGEETVLNGGLQVHTTCDLKLQRLAQDKLVEHVADIDKKIGLRRDKMETLPDDTAIDKRRAEHEAAMNKAFARAQDSAGRVPESPRSILEPGNIYDGVVLEAKPKWVRVGVGVHEVIVPIVWMPWAYLADPNRQWNREANDFTVSVDGDGDGKADGPLVRKGDVVKVEVTNPSTKAADLAKVFVGTPGATQDLVAGKFWQDPEIESALMSFDLDSGAVRTLVGGSDFAESQFIRPTQARRQVGSTFKPIVYAAAIDTRRISAGSVVTDAPLAFATADDFVWKPDNFGGEYMGNITLRLALAASKNTCTVRVIETTDPGMNGDVVFQFARKLGIGGPPTHELPADYVTTPENEHLCPWVKEAVDSTICFDHYPPRTDKDSNMRHRANLKPDDVHMCRACDYSLALGSGALTMEELMRAYSAFGTAGRLVQPYYVDEVDDRHGDALEKHEKKEFPQVIDPGVAFITNWLLQGVVQEGTGHPASVLGLTTGGKTGTSNDNKDVWFVGMTPDIITAVWLGFDQPRRIGVSATGGRTAIPLWSEYMKVAAPKATSTKAFPEGGEIEWAQIDEHSGARVSGGRRYPFLKGTAPEETGAVAGQATLQDLTTEL